MRAHVPALRNDHDDIVGEALLSLTRAIRNRPEAFPASWLEINTPTSEAERAHLHKLASVIVKRRIADLFRRRASFGELVEMPEQLPDILAAKRPSPERTVLLARLLETTLSVLGELSEADRDLIAMSAGMSWDSGPVDARDRQRLHRARARIRTEIERRLGASAVELLRTKD